jgi:hypothetical protein
VSPPVSVAFEVPLDAPPSERGAVRRTRSCGRGGATGTPYAGVRADIKKQRSIPVERQEVPRDI